MTNQLVLGMKIAAAVTAAALSVTVAIVEFNKT